jgi:TRAP-type C4-dicarboxylate transport system permease small subunit
MLVLWLTLVGSMVAGRTRNHISIDVVTRYLSPMGKRIAGFLVNLFTAVVCSLLAYHSAGLVRMEYEFGTQALAGYPAWIFQIIMPIGFGILGLRYLISALTGAAVDSHQDQ